jgi:23S rRNA pseudouridine2604 synthase
MTDSIRLAKQLASLITCSRSEAVKYIEGGLVTVDGVVVEEPGFRIGLEQIVELKPGAKLDAIESVTILLHKPAGFDVESNAEAVLKLITAESQATDDRSGLRFIKRHLKELALTDPLGAQSSGLLVLTQDWRIARKLIADAAKVEQEFIVDVSGTIAADGIELLNKGLNVKGVLTPVKASWQNETRLRFAVKGNQRIQIVRLCESVGLTVTGLKRIRIGRLSMSSLQPGQWRYLLGYERF